ncbi:MAG: hypothetical protein ACRDYF_14335 [Acidimicrobiia bacterium]
MRWLPLSVAVLAVPAVVGAIRLVMATQRPFDFFGDEAILESAVRHVGEQLVGPYSRFGFHQPGAAYYYLQAPFYRLPGASAAALFLGAYCINLGAALGCVLVVRRFFGESAARWAAVVVGALLLCLTPRLVADAWNPYVLALPVLFTMVLAGAGTRSPAAAGGAIVVGSYVVQTHVAAAATLAAVFATAALVAALHRLRTRPQSPTGAPPSRSASVRRWAAPAATIVVLALMWAPPLIEQATRSPGNLTKLTRFFRAMHPEFDRGIDHGVDHTAGQVAAQLTVLPFGHDREAKPAETVKVLLAVLGMAAGIGVAAAGWRRRETVIASLGAMSVVGPLVAIWSGTRIVGEIFPYLLLWTSSLLLPGAIAAGALFLPPRRPGRALAGIAAGVVGFGLLLTMARHPLRPYPSVTDVAAAASLAEPWLASRGVAHVRIGIAGHDRWPLASGIAVRLEKDGFTSTVDQGWTSLFGEHFRPTNHEQATVWIADADGTPPPTEASPTPLGVVGDATVWASTSAIQTP